jgi:hypothetical protein
VLGNSGDRRGERRGAPGRDHLLDEWGKPLAVGSLAVSRLEGPDERCGSTAIASAPRQPAPYFFRMEYSVGPAKSALGSIIAETSPRGYKFKSHDMLPHAG